MKYFSASLDWPAKIATCMPPFAVAAILVMMYQRGEPPFPAFPFVLCVPFALLMVLGYAGLPKGYWLSGRQLKVQRPFGTKDIPLTPGSFVRLGEPEDSAWMIKVFASAGLFGYYGWFRTSGLGLAKWYATRRRKLVVIETMGKKYVISPDDPEGLVAALDRTEDRWGGDRWA